jgi:hypothetical protein
MREASGGRRVSELVSVQRGFAQWRRMGKRGARIPESLWALAVKLSAAHGLHPTAQALGLDYYGLKKRVAQTAATPIVATPPNEAFVELAAPLLARPQECVIELENVAGTRMRVHVKGGDAPDLAALARSLWSAG